MRRTVEIVDVRSSRVGDTRLYRKAISAGASDGALLLAGRDLLAFLIAAIDRAQHRVLVTQFVVDVRWQADERGDVRALLHALARAKARGVSVAVVLPTVLAEGWPTVFDVNEAATRFLSARGVWVARYHGQQTRPYLHAKAVIADGTVVVGNANWTPGAFVDNAELSVALTSTHVADFALRRFHYAWDDAFGQPGPAETDAAYDARIDELHGGSRVLGRFLDLTRGVVRPPPGSARSTVAASAEAALSARGEELVGQLHGAGHARGRRARLLGGQTYLAEVLAAMDGATTRLWVAMSGLKAAESDRLLPLLHSLARAHTRGLDVRVLYDGSSKQKDLWSPDAALLRELGVPSRAWSGPGRFHSRALLIDADKTFIGSAGWTSKSIFLTEELTASVTDADLARSYEAWFRTAWDPPLSLRGDVGLTTPVASPERFTRRG